MPKKKKEVPENLEPQEEVIQIQDDIPTAEDIQNRLEYLAEELSQLAYSDAKKVWKASKCLRKYNYFINVE